MDWRFFAATATGLVLVWAALVALLWLLRPKETALAELVRIVPDVVRLGRGVVADSRAPIGARIAVLGLLAWLLNPIDLIPEFIPVLGPLDDVVVAVLVLRYVRRRVGAEDFRRRWPGTDDGYALLARVL